MNPKKNHNRIYSSFFREGENYTLIQIAKIFNTSIENIIPIIKKLKLAGIIKSVKVTHESLNDINNEDLCVTNDFNVEKPCFFVFDYVGIVSCKNFIFKCYPKYLSSNDEQEKYHELKTAMQIMKKCNYKEQILGITYDIDNHSEYNLLTIIYYLINNYIENGIYQKTYDNIEKNIDGEIVWDKTINEIFPILKDNKPYYFDFYNTLQENNDYDYFTRLHKAIINECSYIIIESQLEDILPVQSFILSDDRLYQFGAVETIQDKILQEMSNQYVDDKQVMLRLMYAFVSKMKDKDLSNAQVSFIGTNQFNLVWEKVCSKIFNNSINEKVSSLNFSTKNIEDVHKTLLELIDKPRWTIEGNVYIKDSLIPDIISVEKMRENITFNIIDAKYYCIEYEKNVLKNNPGIADITKQFIYQMAYNEFLKYNNINIINNILVFPNINIKEIEFKGEVDIGFIKDINNDLKPIRLLFINPNYAYKYFLSNKKIYLSEM